MAYRARLYDAAASPAGGAAYGGASGGEVEDGLTPCTAPAGVSSVAIAQAGGSQVAVTWAAVAGADHYEVWRATNEPYFVPGMNCAAPGIYGCATVVGMSYPDAGLGDPLNNYTYAVPAVSACGAKSAASYPRAGEFVFALVPGLP